MENLSRTHEGAMWTRAQKRPMGNLSRSHKGAKTYKRAKKNPWETLVEPMKELGGPMGGAQ